MHLKMKFRDVPGRVTTGAFILHSGLEKWGGDEERATALHGFASGAYPRLKSIPPKQFMKLLAGSEIALGTALLAPVVSDAAAGLALCGFSGSLLGLYWRTESMHKPNSPWPTQAGTAISKDVWMLGIGAGLVLSGMSRGRKKSSKRKSR
jgi:uncharacterized membrane protein YphA (DoxX/SURF4 family)